MSFTPEQLSALNQKLDKGAVKSRSQSGQTLSYIEGHVVIRQMNSIFGPDGWDRLTENVNLVQCEQKTNSNNKELWYVGYIASCRVTVDRVTRVGYGFGQGIDADQGRAHESAIKEAETDAFKRAAMTLGDPLGLALYDKSQEHVGKPETEQEKIRRIIREMGISESELNAFKVKMTAQNQKWTGALIEAYSRGEAKEALLKGMEQV